MPPPPPLSRVNSSVAPMLTPTTNNTATAISRYLVVLLLSGVKSGRGGTCGGHGPCPQPDGGGCGGP